MGEVGVSRQSPLLIRKRTSPSSKFEDQPQNRWQWSAVEYRVKRLRCRPNVSDSAGIRFAVGVASTARTVGGRSKLKMPDPRLPAVRLGHVEKALNDPKRRCQLQRQLGCQSHHEQPFVIC